MDLTSFVSTIRQIDPGTFGGEKFNRALSGVRLTEREVLSFPVRDGGYTRTLMFANAAFEIMVLRWTPQAQTAIHDHAGQQCWFTAVRGAFDLANYRRLAGGHTAGYARLEIAGTQRSVGLGEPDYRYGETDIHRVSVTAGCEGAVSVHVYARPVAECLIFDESSQRCTRKAMSYDHVRHDRILLATG